MSNGNEPIHMATTDNGYIGQYEGLTKREYFAAMAMQGLAARGPNSIEYIASYAVDLADELIKALNETP